jgi:citrate lyase subunit beta/citryl-CoA lyase
MAADGVILDLEDAVPPAQKPQAREWVVAALRRVDFGPRERIVRVNAPGTPEHAGDLAAVVAAGPDALLLPKLSDAAGLARLDAEVGRLEAASDRPVGTIRFHLLVETVAAVVHLDALARAVPRAAALFYGAGDLAREMRARLVPGRLTELYAMSQVVLVARATGLDAIDSPCFDLGQAERLEDHTQFGADLGYDGKALIHPSQIPVANRWFTPSPEAVAEARRVLAAYEEAEGKGRGALALEGQFVDAVHVLMARDTLARARLAGVLG